MRSIRFRLTVWYFFSVAVVLTLFACGAWLAMRNSVFEAVDLALQQRLRDVREFTGRQLNTGPNQLLEELQEQAQLGLGGALLQVEESGRILYSSPRLASVRLVRSLTLTSEPQFLTQTSSPSYLRVASQPIDVEGRRFIVYVAEPLHEYLEAFERFRAILLISAPVFLVFASLGGYWISSRALSPVDRITSQARLVSITNLSTRLPVPRTQDEIQRLTETLNEMLDRIDTAVQRLVQFTADASHELRAPLTLIHTASEFSLRRERTHDELLEALRKILRESSRTSRLVDELLLLARADSGRDGLELAPIELQETSLHAIDQALTLAQPKNIEVLTDLPAVPIRSVGDEQALSRLWLILLDNAVKYTNEGGRVVFSMREAGGYAEVLVSDTGVGIEPADLPHVYDRFWRADRVRSRTTGGAGLGLSIARWIVERHHGQIEIRSEAGQGTTVQVRLGLACVPGTSLHTEVPAYAPLMND